MRVMTNREHRILSKLYELADWDEQFVLTVIRQNTEADGQFDVDRVVRCILDAKGPNGSAPETRANGVDHGARTGTDG